MKPTPSDEPRCSICRHHKRLDFVDWFCGHPDSPFFNKETESFDVCDKFEEVNHEFKNRSN